MISKIYGYIRFFSDAILHEMVKRIDVDFEVDSLVDLRDRRKAFIEKIKLSANEPERIHELLDTINVQLGRRGYTRKSIREFEVIVYELVSNALEYALSRNSEDKAKIIVQVSKAFAYINVINPKKDTFCLTLALEEQKKKTPKGTSDRGRGLLLCNDYADILSQDPELHNVKATLFCLGSAGTGGLPFPVNE